MAFAPAPLLQPAMNSEQTSAARQSANVMRRGSSPTNRGPRAGSPRGVVDRAGEAKVVESSVFLFRGIFVSSRKCEIVKPARLMKRYAFTGKPEWSQCLLLSLGTMAFISTKVRLSSD